MKKFFSEIEDNFCAGILLVMTILTCINVCGRYLLKYSMPFVEELTSLGLIIISLTGAAVAAKKGAHLGLTVLTDFLSKRNQKVFILLGHLCGVAFGFIMMYFGVLMARQEYILEQLTAGMQWPEWLFGMFIPISGAILIIRYLQLFAQVLLKKEEH